MITKRMIRDFIKAKIATDDRWLLKSLKKVYSLQTAEEKAVERTRFHNCVGFTGHDAEYLSSLANQLQNKGWLSPKQKTQLRKMMPKYWKQIYGMCDLDKLQNQIVTAKEQNQLSLFGAKNEN